MSDTPRTDAAIKASKGQWGYLLRDLAQEMERELAAERVLADRLAHWLSEMADEFILPAELENGFNNALAAWKESRNE